MFYFIFKITRRVADDGAAVRATLYATIFPTSFFFFAAYTESLFLLFALAAMQSAGDGQWGRAGVLGALAALTRLQGVLLVLPLGILLWRQWLDSKSQGQQPSTVRNAVVNAIPLLLIPLATSGSYCIRTCLSNGHRY